MESNENKPSGFFQSIKAMRGMDYYRLQFGHRRSNLPSSERDALDGLYHLSQTQILIATVLEAIMTFGQSVFLLSRRDCQELIQQNPKVIRKFMLDKSASGGAKRAYAGMQAELEGNRKVIKITIAGKNKPMVVEVIDASLLEIIGKSSEEYRQLVYQSVGLTPEDSGLSTQYSELSSQVSGLRSQDSVLSTQGQKAHGEAHDRAQQKAHDSSDEPDF
jgi:hypothetical protein